MGSREALTFKEARSKLSSKRRKKELFWWDEGGQFWKWPACVWSVLVTQGFCH